MSVSTPSIKPQSGEQYSQFVVRAHGALMKAIPDPDKRNEKVWSEWYSVHGDPLADRADELFPPSKYRKVPKVCYFMEHATMSRAVGQPGEPGYRPSEPVRYSVKEIGDIVSEHIERTDTDNYTAMTDGHTVERPAIAPPGYEHPKPAVVGYAGPYRMGMTGRTNPKWAVFADEHHMKDSITVLDKKHRRSVELNRFRDGRRPFIDPVAVLGSEPPRLALPVARYEEDGAIVERYEAPACVSGTNTYLPEPIKDRHSAESPNVDMNPATNDQDALVRNILQAFLQTNEMQFVRSMMTQQQGGAQPGQPGSMPGGDPSQSPVSQPQASPQSDPNQGAPNGGDDPGMGGGNGAPNMSQNQPQRYRVTEDSQVELVERFSQLNDEHAELTERYSQLEAANQANMRDMARMKAAVVQLEQVAVDAQRTERIKDLYSLYPHAIELQEEMETCLYSHGSDMGSEAFEKHISLVEKMAKRSSPVTRMIPGGEVGMSEVERNSADFAERVVERYTLEASRPGGRVMSYEEVEAIIRSEMSAGR